MNKKTIIIVLLAIINVTPSSLKAHLKQLLKKGNLHVGYLTTE